MRKCRICNQEKTEDLFALTGYTRAEGGVRTRKKSCKSCAAKYTKEYRDSNTEYAAAAAATTDAWRKRNPFRKKLASSRAHAKRLGYLPCTASHLEIKEAFAGKCEICGVPESECNQKLSMDHDHETGEFRGWLCSNCNFAIGYLKNSPELLKAAIIYLEDPKKVKK